MTVVIKLGGCNGSGKTSVARALMEQIGVVPIRSGGKIVGYHSVYHQPDAYVLGSYENVCGGMDTISDKDRRFKLVSDFAKIGGIIFFEGLITGKTYGAFGALSEQHRANGIQWLYTFMDTPFDVCVERVLQRRAAKGNDAPFDPERTMRPTFNSCERLEEKLRRGILPEQADWRHHVHSINHTVKPATAARLLLKKALELHHARR